MPDLVEPKDFAGQAGFLLCTSNITVVGHDDLRSGRKSAAWGAGTPRSCNGLHLLDKVLHTERATPLPMMLVMWLLEHAGRQLVQGKLAIIVDDGVAGVAAALEPDHNVRICAARTSVILPLPSSPQLAPTIALTIIYSSKFLLLHVFHSQRIGVADL